MPIAWASSWTLFCPGVGMSPATASSPCDSAMSHCASMSPPDRIGSSPGFSRSRSSSFSEPARTSGTGGSMRSSMPSRFRSTRSFSLQSMSFSVLSMFLAPARNTAISLPTHQVGFVDVDGLPVMEQRDEYGQPDSSLGRRNGHDEEDEDEAVKLMELPRVGEEGQVDGVHHQLDAHEHGDAVLARQESADADGEEDGAEDEEPTGRNHGRGPSSVIPSVARDPLVARAGGSSPSLRLGMTPRRALSSSAPTIAASRRIDTISNGKM